MNLLYLAVVVIVSAWESPKPPCRQAGDDLGFQKLPRGAVSVEEFGADPSGMKDSTNALQQALDAARMRNITLFLPLGCYIVTQPLVATEPRNGRWQPTNIIGELPRADGRRPTLVLPPSTPAFADAKKFRPMLAFWTNWCLSYGPEFNHRFEDEWCSPDTDASMSPYLFNMVLNGVDFIIGEGNPSAAGVLMIAAQGSTLQDVTVYAAPDALAGVAGGNGGGGVFVGVKVVGARIGLDARNTDGAASFAAISMINQSCAGVLVGPGTGSTTSITGLHLEGAPSLGGVVAARPLPSGPCAAAEAAGGWRPKTPFLTAQPESSHTAALSDPVSIIDASINMFGSAPCVTSGASLWIQNMYSIGCKDVIVAGDRSVVLEPPQHWTHISELALGRQDWKGISNSPFQYAFPSIVDGHRTEDLLLSMDQHVPPSDLQSRHWWPLSSPHWQSPTAVDVTSLGAKGDGVTDDWQILQDALDGNDIVVLPRGLFRLSKPLVMRRKHSALIGLGAAQSFLMPLSEGFQPQEQPVLHMDSADGNVNGVSLVTWSHLASTYTLLWTGQGVWRKSFVTREPEFVFQPFDAFDGLPRVYPEFKQPVSYNRPMAVIEGGGAFYDFDLDFGCCFGHVTNPDASSAGGPEISSTDEVLLQRPGYRTLLIDGSTTGLRFYPHNTEQAFSDAYTEIRNSHNVTLYNHKSENNYASIWIHDSDLITVHGYGGNACPFPNTARYDDSDIRGDLGVDFKWADLGPGCCKDEPSALFDGDLDGGLHACKAKCQAFENCGYIIHSSDHGHSTRCTVLPDSTNCLPEQLDRGETGHCASRGDDDVHSYRFLSGYKDFMPASFRVQRSSRVTLANIVNTERIEQPTTFVSAGNGYSPKDYNLIIQQDGDDFCDPAKDPGQCSASPSLDRPVLWRWSGSHDVMTV